MEASDIGGSHGTFWDHSPAESQVILLSDDDTVRHRDAMAELAAQQACAITDAFSFSPERQRRTTI
ncbi:hypothetical protein I553_2478 [Mycobacterium xenopi 4042]|uniref:Uncharacterized protein n=1 Tax=Mycobacterium xenopi 4042 TaxID=1299334 RepID=X8C7I8_MYCXE|nr:hypothetical protein I553_2478 [Mycobacterium xenopi 4042]